MPGLADEVVNYYPEWHVGSRWNVCVEDSSRFVYVLLKLDYTYHLGLAEISYNIRIVSFRVFLCHE